jgi:hypothetical protein
VHACPCMQGAAHGGLLQVCVTFLCFVRASVTTGALRVRSFFFFVPRAVDFFPLFVGLIP